jgi:hypothetical protein
MIQIAGGERCKATGQLKRKWVPVLERRPKIQLCQLLADRFGNLGPTVARPTGPQAGQAIEDTPPFIVNQVTTFAANDHPWILFEIPVARVGHPIRIKILS